MNRVFLGYSWVEETGVGGCTDENNCSTSATATINGNSVLSASIGNTQDPTCWNYCNGEEVNECDWCMQNTNNCEGVDTYNLAEFLDESNEILMHYRGSNERIVLQRILNNKIPEPGFLKI